MAGREPISGTMLSIYELADGLFHAGAIDRKTMREFDEACLKPVEPLAGDEIRALREREDVSQAIFAMHLNVSKDLVSKWERGAKRPSGPSLKLLNLVKAK